MTLHRPIAALVALTLLGQSVAPVFVYAAPVSSNTKSVSQQDAGVVVSAPVEATLSATDSVPMEGQEVIDIRTASKLSGLRAATGESAKASVATPTVSVRRVPSVQKGRVLTDVSLEAVAQSEALRQVDTDLIKRLSPQLMEVDTPKEEKKPVESTPSLREKIRSFLTTFLSVPTVHATELTPFIETYDGIEENRMDFLLQSLSGMQNSDGSIGTTDRYMISADAMMLLNRYRRTDSDQFDLLLSYLQTATTTNNRELSMRARLASAWGEDPIPLLDSLIAQQSTEDGSIPFAPGYAPDLTATLEFAVALAAANYSIDNALPKALHYVLTRIPDSGQMRYTAGGEPSYIYGADVARKLKPFAAFSVGIGGGGPSISVQPKITALLNYVQSQYDAENGTLLGTDDPSDQLSVVRALRAYDVNAPMQQALADVAVQTQVADGSMQYSPYATIAGFDVFAHSDLQISTAVVNGTLRNRTTVPFTVTVHNRGYTTVSSSVLHFFIDNVNLGATVDLGANGVTLGPDDSAVLTVNYSQSLITNRVLGPTEFSWYLDTPSEAVETMDNNWFGLSATVEPPTTAAPATPLYYTAVPITSATVPKISFRWHSRVDANRRNYVIAYRVTGTVNWSYLAISPNQTGTTISGFTEGAQYDVTVGVLHQNGSTLTIDPTITTVRATVTPTSDGVVQGAVKGDVSAQIAIASVTEGVSVATTTASVGSFGANTVVSGRHAFAASAAQYQGVMTVAGLVPTVTTTISIFTRLKPDDVAPSVSSLTVAGGGVIKNQRDNILVASTEDNVAVKEVDFYYFDTIEEVWLYIGTANADTENVARLSWYIPATVIGDNVSIQAVAHDYQHNTSVPFVVSDLVVSDGSIPDVWSQSDWSGGAGAELFSSVDQYLSDTGVVDTSVSGTLRLAQSVAACQGYTWDFTTSSDYAFDPQQTRLEDGYVSSVPPEGFSETKTWDFSVPQEYVYDVTQAQIQNGSVSVVGQEGFSETKTWDFSAPEDYVVSGGAQVVGGVGSIKLSADDENTVALYHLDDMSGTLIDSSEQHNHLAIVGTPTHRLPGLFDSSVLFDATGNDYARILDTEQSGLDGMSQLTIDAWVKRATIPVAESAIVRKWSTATGRSYALHVNQSGSVRFYASSNGSSYTLATTPNNAVPHDTWTHIAAVYDGSVLRIFVNGVQQGDSPALSGTIFNGGDLFTLSYPGSPVFNGYIDEVRISNVARWTDSFSVPTLRYGILNQQRQTIIPIQTISVPAVEEWTDFAVSSTVDVSATLGFQLSDNDGDTWQYWNGSAWVEAASTNLFNTADEVSDHITSFSTATGQLSFRAVLQASGSASVQIDTVSVSYVMASIDDAVVALYQFEETAGAFLDRSGRSNHLTPFGTPTRAQSGKFSLSTLFDAVGNDYTRILDTAQSGLDGMDQLTIDGWVKRMSTSTADAVLVRKWGTATGRSYSLQVAPSGAIRFYLSNNGATHTLLTTPNNVVPTQEWVHIAAVYDGVSMRVFVNGRQTGTAVAHTGSVFNGTDQFQLSTVGSGALHGYLDEVRISNVARWTGDFTPPSRAYGGASSDVHVVTPVQSIRAPEITRWTGFAATSTVVSPAFVGFQLSDDLGATWRYWNGGNWALTTTTLISNTASEINTHISSFSTSSATLSLRALLSTGGTADASLDEVSISYEVPRVDSAVVGLWQLDEMSGAFGDSSGRGNTLLTYGFPDYGQEGRFGSSALFDAHASGNDFAYILDAAQSGLDGMTQLTIDGWVKRATVNPVDAVVARKWTTSNGKSYSVQVTSLGAVRFYVSVDGVNSVVLTTPNNVISAGTWTHLAAVYDGALMRVFVNGQMVGIPVAQTGAVFNGADRFQISNAGTSVFNGYIDELRVSNVARWTSNFTPYTSSYGGNVRSTAARIVPATSFAHAGVGQWHSFTEVAEKNSGNITYQMSVDEGETWQYWNGTAWVVATAEAQVNTADVISLALWALPVDTKQIIFRAFVSGDAVLDSVRVDCSTLQVEAGEMMLPANSSTPISFTQRYNRPVVVAMSDATAVPAIVEVYDVSEVGATMLLRTQDGSVVSSTRVSYLVVEEGVWSLNGLPLEARRTSSTSFDHYGSWQAPTTTFRQTFMAPPVVLAQRIGVAAGLLSAYITGPSQYELPSTTTMRVGLYGHASAGAPSSETISWIAMGTDTQLQLGQAHIETGRHTSVHGFDEGCTEVPITQTSSLLPLVVASTQALVSVDGGWAVRCGVLGGHVIGLMVDDDTIDTAERSATSTPVGYIVISQPFSYSTTIGMEGGYKLFGQLWSSAFNFDAPSTITAVSTDVTMPSACGSDCVVNIFIRTAPNISGVAGTWSEWYGPLEAGAVLPLWLQGQEWVQYRVDLFGNGSDTPVLEQIQIEYGVW
jgi:hypothetical protein